MDADAVAVEEVVAEVELVEGEGDEEGCEGWGLVGGAEEGEDEVWPIEELVLERREVWGIKSRGAHPRKFIPGRTSQDEHLRMNISGCTSQEEHPRKNILGSACQDAHCREKGVRNSTHRKICFLPNRCPVRAGN
jgi:hypothetical protein